MSFPEFHLSKPGMSVPENRIDNAEILRRVRERYRGADVEWPNLQTAIERVFALCESQYRYLDGADEARVADYAVAAAQECLEVNEVTTDEIDLVVHGSIARQYFEPATAMEVAAQLGLKKTHAFDVTAACVGHLEAIQTAAAYLHLHDHYRTALVCTAELCRQFLDYDIQSVNDLYLKSAGLTVGNAAACVLLRKVPWPNGGVKLLGMKTYTAPDHWHLCQAPIDGKFSSSSVELVRLGKLIPPWLAQLLPSVGWTPRDVDHFLFHQPSVSMVRKIIEDTGGDPERGIFTHPMYGNTASASVGVTYHRLLTERQPKAGDKILMASAAAGFSIVAAMGEWTGVVTG